MDVKIGQAYVEFVARKAADYNATVAKVKKDAESAANGAIKPYAVGKMPVDPPKPRPTPYEVNKPLEAPIKKPEKLTPPRSAAQGWADLAQRVGMTSKNAKTAGSMMAGLTGETAAAIPATASLAGALLPVAAAALLVWGGIKLVAKVLPELKQAADELKQLKVAGDVAGLTGSQLSGMAYAMDRATNSLNSFLALRAHWNSQILDLQFGTGQAGAALRILGVRAVDAKGQLRDLTDVLPELGRAMERYNAADRQRLSGALFGGGSDTFLKMLSQGADSLERMQASAKALGITVNQSTVDAGAQVSDTWGTLGSEFKALWQNLVAALSPLIIPILAGVIRVLGSFNRAIGIFNAVVIKPITAMFSAIWRAFSAGAAWADRVASKLGWLRNLSDWLFGGGKADDKSSSALGRGQLSLLQGGGFGATIGGLVDFSRTMVQNAAGAFSLGQAQLNELRTHTGLLGQIAGQADVGAVPAVGP